MKNNITPIVKAISEIEISGNITPLMWYQNIRSYNKRGSKPHLLAITILSDIIYWYKPKYIRHEETGELVAITKKFKGNKLQRSSRQCADRFGVSEDVAYDALCFLREEGLIEITVVNERLDGGGFIKKTYLEPIPEQIKKVTFDKIDRTVKSPLEGELTEPSNHGQPNREITGITEITSTEISFKKEKNIKKRKKAVEENQNDSNTSTAENNSPKSSSSKAKKKKNSPQVAGDPPLLGDKLVEAVAHKIKPYHTKASLDRLTKEQKDCLFENWWKVYPRKQGKEDARKVFLNAVKDVGYFDFHNATVDYHQEQAKLGNTTPAKRKWIKLPAPFINSKRYMDYITVEEEKKPEPAPDIESTPVFTNQQIAEIAQAVTA